MAGVQLSGFAAEKTLAKVSRVPQVKIPDLRSLNADNSEKVSSRDIKSFTIARLYSKLGNLFHVFACLFI